MDREMEEVDGDNGWTASVSNVASLFRRNEGADASALVFVSFTPPAGVGGQVYKVVSSWSSSSSLSS